MAVLGRTFRQWEPYLKTCVPGFRIDLNAASMLLHDSLNGVEAEAEAFSNSFGSEEGFEDVRLYIGRDSGAVVGDLNHNAIVLAIGADSKLAFPAHRANGVVDDVGPNLIEFAPK